MKNNIRVILSAMLSVTLLFGTVLPAGAAEKKARIGYTCMDAGHPYFASVIEGLKERCDELGAELIVHDSKFDSARQVSGMENFISMGVDAILIAPFEPTAMTGAVKTARDVGIPVIAMNTPIPGADANITVDEYKYGYAGGLLAGEWIKNKLGGKAEVALLVSIDMDQLVERAKGLEEGILSLAPDAKIVSKQPGNKLEDGMNAAETILQANPNVKVFAAVNDAGALGAMESIRASGIDTAGFYVGGLDATEEALEKIADANGIYRATVDLDPKGSGKMAVDTIMKVIKDGPIAEYIYMEMKPVKQKGF